MCCFDKEDWKHIKLLIWRSRKIMGRKKAVVIGCLSTFFIYLFIAMGARLGTPPKIYQASTNQDKLYTYTSSQFTKQDDWINTMDFAQAC